MTEYFWWLAALAAVGVGGLLLVLSARTTPPEVDETDDAGPDGADEPPSGAVEATAVGGAAVGPPDGVPGRPPGTRASR
jgi:hypothetical protein